MYRPFAWLALAVAIVIASWVGTPGIERAVAVPRPATLRTDLQRRPPSLPPLRIEGEVSGVPVGGSGTLTVVVDGKAVVQVGATEGAFSVEMPAFDAARMVALEYTQPGVHFTSPLGSYARLVRLAGSDARLTRQECECTRISAFGTALQFVAEMFHGRPPQGDSDLANTVRQAGYDLETATVVLARLATEPGLLPAAYENGLALLRDRAAFVDYLAQTDYAILQDPDAVLDALPSAAMSEGELPASLAFLGAILDVQRPTPAVATVMERSGGTFMLHGGIAQVAQSYSGTVDNQALTLVPAGDISFVNQGVRWCESTMAMTGERWLLLRRDYRRQWSNGRLEIWRGGAEHEVSYPDCPELPARVERSSGFGAMVDLAESRLLTNARRFLGTRALPIFCDATGEYAGSELIDCGYAVHAFAHDGNGEIVDLGDKVGDAMQPVQAGSRLQFSWEMGTDGAMHVQTGAERTRYWVIDGGDGVALGVVYVADAERDAGRFSIAGYSTMIRADSPDFYAPDNVQGAWGYASMDFSNRPHVDGLPPRQVRIVREESGRSVQWYGDNPLYVERWTTAWGRLYSTAYLNDTECVAPSPQCWPDSVRYFRPLARAGNRIHGIEEYYVNAGGEAPHYGAVLGWARPQFHEPREMPTGSNLVPGR